MKWDYADRRRRERFYRFVFRSAIPLLALGALCMALGVGPAVHANFGLLLAGFVVADLSVLAGYLAVNRTVKVLDLDRAESRYVEIHFG